MDRNDLPLSGRSRREIEHHRAVEQAVQGSLSSQFDIAIPSTFALENRVTLYHGDCMEFLHTIPDASVQLGVTSPGAEIVKRYYDLAVDRIKKAFVGELRIRPDKPVYKPSQTSKLTINPWENESQEVDT